MRDRRRPPPWRMRADPRGEVAQLHRGRRPDRRRQGGRGRSRAPCARCRGRRRRRHDRDARLRRHAPPRVDVALPEPGRRGRPRRRAGVVVGARRAPAARRRLRRDVDRPVGRGGGRDHHRGRLGRPPARGSVGGRGPPGPRRRGTPHRVRPRGVRTGTGGRKLSDPRGARTSGRCRRAVDHDRARHGGPRIGAIRGSWRPSGRSPASPASGSSPTAARSLRARVWPPI